MKMGREAETGVELVANLHAHTPYSDGEWHRQRIAEAAARAGVDVLVVTDHNVYVRGADRFVGRVLVLAGEEVHDPTRQPQASHCLIYEAREELAPLAAKPQALIDAANARGGMAFLAHPFEVASPLTFDLLAIPWADWEVRRFAGIELWNAMSDFKARARSWPLAVFYAFFPSWALRGPFPQTLRKWDELLTSGEKVVAIGNSDAHGTVFHVGPIQRAVLGYEVLFRSVNTHLLLPRPLTGDVEADRQAVFAALRAGRCFIGYDRPASTRGFRFTAQSGAQVAGMGETLTRSGVTTLRITAPRRARLRLLRNGACIAQRTGDTLEHLALEPGSYRSEAWLDYRLARRPWVFSNPITVR